MTESISAFQADETPQESGTQALKIKLEPAPDQYGLLNEAFWKWAAICEMSAEAGRLESLKEKKPVSDSALWFNKTQMTQAKVDIANLRAALKQQGRRVEYEMNRLELRRDTIKKAIDNPNERVVSPDRKNLFRPLEWEKRGLKGKYHTARYYSGQVEEIQRKLSKKRDTLEKISKGTFSFKPTRICVWATNIRVNFGAQKISLNMFEPRKELVLPAFFSPEQPLRGSTNKSAEYLRGSLSDLVAYSINSLLFGLSNSERMLAKAKRPEKVAKFEEKKKKKLAGWQKKKREVVKLAGRALSPEEEHVLDSLMGIFSEKLVVPMTDGYRAVLSKVASDVLKRDDFVCLNKYPILLRIPKKAFHSKSQKNLKPEQWDYYIQFGYSPLLSEKTPITPKSYLGIDRGVSSLMAVSILDPSKNAFVFNKLYPNEITPLKRRYRKLKRSIQHLERRIRAQTGDHIHEKQMQKQLRTIRDRVDSVLHRVSSEIVSLAKEHQSAIVMEALADMKQHARNVNKWNKELNYVLSQFDYANLGKYIAYKARREGVPVFVVDPANTSKNCNRCLLAGRNSSDNYARGFQVDGRKNMKIGRCSGCADKGKQYYEIDADLNAARVIALCKYLNQNEPRPFGQAKTKRR
ncbi:MAG: transposase [Candidatus Micrarchaeia archaeon]